MSDSADLKKQLEDAIVSYHKAVENVGSFETKLRETRRPETDALTDDSGDEKRIVKAVAEAQGLQSVLAGDCNWLKRRSLQPSPQSRPSPKFSPRI